jgi:hypothetical protein
MQFITLVLLLALFASAIPVGVKKKPEIHKMQPSYTALFLRSCRWVIASKQQQSGRRRANIVISSNI